MALVAWILFGIAPVDLGSFVSCLRIEVAYAQFGAGRDRDSVFRSNSRDRSRGRSPQQYEQDEPQPPPPAPPQPQEQGQVAPPPPQRPRVAPAPAERRTVPVRKPAAPPGKQPPQTEETGTGTGIPPEGHLILRIAPLEMKADVGEVFPVHVWLDNPEEKAFDVVSFALSYDPNLLEFLDAPGGIEGEANSYDASEKCLETFNLVRDPLEDPFYLNWADTEKGLVYYRARCASGTVCKSEGFLLSMKFRALASIDRTGLRFLFSKWSDKLAPPIQSDQTWSWPDAMTFVGKTPNASGGKEEGWVNMLGVGASKTDGVISANLSLWSFDKESIIEELVRVPEGETRTRLRLDPPLSAVQAGKTFDVDVHLDNPNRIAWDRVRLDIRFDPRVLEVVDHDEGNWLTIGTNILDGPYHDRFPFEFMRDNQARNDSGRILYDCMVFRKPLQVGGVLATIRFRALVPIPETRLTLYRTAGENSRDGTSLTLKRSDVLADTNDPLDGVFGAAVVVVPRKELISAKSE